MRARLTDGSIVTLEKDCGCTHHDGPHWLHMDSLDRRMNMRLLDKGNNRGFAQAEVKRLEAKEHAMTSRNITEIFD